MANTQQQIRNALRAGEQRAKRVVRLRNIALKKREAALGKIAVPKAQPAVAPKFIKAAGSPASAGLLVAEGDSWFDYPGADVLSLLEDEHAYEVEGVANAGDRVENMAYIDGQLADLSRVIEKAIRDGSPPLAILLSGGGNDIAGPEFEMLLDHADSPNPGLNKIVVDGILNQRVFYSYVTIIRSVTELCVARLGRPVPIITHGYDYAVPDGRGFGWSVLPFLPGPWLKPSLDAKGYSDDKRRRAVVTDLIDAFNAMMQRLGQVQGFGHVHFVDLRRTLPNQAGVYRRWWANELHPTSDGFSLVAQRFAQAIARATTSPPKPKNARKEKRK